MPISRLETSATSGRYSDTPVTCSMRSIRLTEAGGYGLIRAAQGVATHIELAANSPGASANVRTHAEHVATIARSVAQRAEATVAVAQRLQRATSIRQAAPLVAELRLSMYQIAEGGDRNGDGNVALDDEAGGQQLEAHVYLLLVGEGLPRVLR